MNIAISILGPIYGTPSSLEKGFGQQIYGGIVIDILSIWEDLIP
jgi:hypothetical protein